MIFLGKKLLISLNCYEYNTFTFFVEIIEWQIHLLSHDYIFKKNDRIFFTILNKP